MKGEVLLTGVCSEDNNTHNRIVTRGTGKLDLEYKDDEAITPNALTGKQTDRLFSHLYTFVNNITANQAKQIICVLVSAGINIIIKNRKIELRANNNNILFGSFITRCPTAYKGSDITSEKIIYSLLKRAGYGVTDDYEEQTCLTRFDCTACRFTINYLYTLWNISRGKVKEVPVGVPVTTTHTCKAHRLIHSNMLITNCNYKPIYYTDITKFCPYCGGRLDIIDI